MTRIFIFISIFIASVNFTFAGNSVFIINKKAFHTLADIPLNLSAKDKRSNIQLRPKFTVISVGGGNIIPLKETDGRFMVTVKSGESYKILAELEGYHTKEKIQVIASDQDIEGFNVVLDMEPQPSASLILKAIDDISGDFVEASFKVTVNDKVYTGKSSKETPYYRLVVTKADLYQIEVTTGTHKPKKESYALEIGDPARTYSKELRLEKSVNGVKFTIVGEDTGKALKGANLNITNTTDNQLIFDNILPEGEASVELNPAKTYIATVQYQGYTTLKIDLKASTQKEYIIKLPSETYVSIGAFDKISGKRLPANFKITYKDNPPQEIKGTLDNDIKYKPTEKGVYQIEVTHTNYGIKNESLNLENLAAGKLQFKINLESTVDDYVILVVDAKDKQMISGADVKLFDESKQPIPVKLNPKTGEWKIVLKKNKDYFIEVVANGYMKHTGTLQRGTSKLIGINMQKVFQAIFYSAIDGITKKPVSAQFKVIRPEQEPLSGSAEINKPFKVDLYPQKPYVLEVGADGYKTISENIIYDDNKTATEAIKVFELKKDAYTFSFKVTDAQKKQAISGAKLLILNLSTSQPVLATLDKNGFTATLVLENNYSISVEAEGYEKSSQNINVRDLAAKNQFEQEIPLFKNAIERYKLVVLDEDKGSNVLNANLRIFNMNNEPIAITANPLASEWLAELKNDEFYNVEIKADGYLAFRGALPKNSSSKTIKLKVKKVPTQEVIFASIDALNKKPVVAEFKLLSGGEIINGTITSGGTKLKAILVQDKNYELEVISSGYKIYKEVVTLTNILNNVITVELKKEAYSFNFKALDSKNRQPVPNVNIKVLDSDNKAVTTKYTIENQDFQANLSPDKKYSIEVEAPGYELYGEKIDVANLAVSSDFKRDIFMVKKEVEKIPEPKPEPKIVEVKPVDKKVPEKKIEVKVTDNVQAAETKIETITPTPVTAKKIPEKKEPETKTYQDNAIILTDDDFKVKIEGFENLGIGKRFRLSNVYFEQSSSQIRPQSFPQLDKLVTIMKANPKMKIEILGYTDNNGDPRLNLSLSHFRATVISNYIFNKGVNADKIKATGKGQEEAIAPNDTEENRIKNRRVEFVIREN
ncbi:OmpA family protein [Emticicia sp.]|uniref:OmpA family protein n=1 Tax=Emticicia sp. TaxID=1930953 RepID=UPI0037504087